VTIEYLANRMERVVDHSFQLPLQLAWVVTALVPLGIAVIFEA
jgi:hypothetical protein